MVNATTSEENSSDMKNQRLKDGEKILQGQKTHTNHTKF